jgi:Fic family protein
MFTTYTNSENNSIKLVHPNSLIFMRIPASPPTFESYIASHHVEPDKIIKIINAADGPLVDGHYTHWDKLRYSKPIDGLTIEEWWYAIKFRRRALYKELPLADKNGKPFVYLMVDPSPEILHRIDLGAGGLIQMPDPITNPDTRDRYYIGSLIDEAITSSQLEGAATTRLIAKEMIRTGRAPRDKSERMILNNYYAMREIGKLKNEKLTKDLILRLHKIVTDDTLDDPTAAGRFRRPDENVSVEDMYGLTFHSPPLASELESRMRTMCRFANEEIPHEFIHPAIRSIILHFWLAYDHPFVDGNGRTARALFYWSMLRHDYWLFEFVSISRTIKKAPVKYGRAFLHTESDDNDLTYFIRYHLHVIEKAIEELHDYIKRKTREIRKIETTLRGIQFLNHRQRALISHALRHPQQRYTIESHKNSHNVVYETARSDLLNLRNRGLLKAAKIGREWTFTAVDDLEDCLARLTF